ncbi:MAG TPA: HAD family hydrolase [Syntrophomonas sp.]|nr:HAD family hydrolase [Syntrophomonas sp.]HRW12109.1 HAD family hydrolase [Syntrophomonas sp.]
MYSAILFDLDGTLLHIDMEEFLQYYFAEMMRAAREAGYKEGQKLVEQVFASTSLMLNDFSPTVSNEAVFMGDFLSHCDYPEEEVRTFFDHFYQHHFPRLKVHCRPFPGIPGMMQELFQRGLKVVIATNPVFPREAIQQRLQWAGIDDLPYALVTSYEEMHFCKPQLAYYEEICQRIGVGADECLMVGNDVDEDLPAGLLGMKTYLVEDLLIDKGQSRLFPDWRGSVNDMIAFLKKTGS